ncbi:hypothetical protein NE237_003551 [Protea cynaroides]|uniref:DUF7804 domain-containing protein n=1 Tax=Protea cynaroides TaxID=273540 RepID=A0A9Q0QSQ5_9MAGN|nr:hypothetical protein NE237_003551 [Protea cynaroides]
MACVGLRCSGGVGKAFLSTFNVNADQQQRSCSCRRQLPQAMLKSKSQQPQINTTGNASKLPSMPPVIYSNLKGEISSETLDVWMRNSVSEIVKKIEEAPFLVHLFASNKNGKTEVTQLDREKAVADDWPYIKRRWEEKEKCSTPDGIMLIEELKDENEEDEQGRRGDESSKKAWGIVIQGKGMNCSPACYILETCRVGSPSIGFCTHFSLVKAKFNGETALQQMKNSWLVHPQILDQHTLFF